MATEIDNQTYTYFLILVARSVPVEVAKPLRDHRPVVEGL